MAILGGGSNPGSLSSSSGSGTTLKKTKAPVTYVAPATIEGDSLVVQVAAFAYNPYWTWTPIDAENLEDGGEWQRIDYEALYPTKEGEEPHPATRSSRYADIVSGNIKNPPVNEGW